MSKIVILDEKTANQIAAGEVIERPASVVKEMVENAIDAGADQITVEIKNGGISYIRITDNGSGMDADDVEIAFERHATSKIRKIEDLDELRTLGFRGEALASIAAVSRLEMSTKTEEAPIGTKILIEGGKVMSVSQTGCPKGTSFIVRNLFYNTPARYKFLKKDSTEAGYVADIVERLALAHPYISFKLIQDNQVKLHTPGNNDLLSTLYSVYGKEVAKNVLPVDYEAEGYIVTGFVGKPEIARGNRNNQSVYLNGRYIKSRIVSTAVEEALKTLLMQNKFPFFVLYIKAPIESFDVNVHPQKLEVRFSNEKDVFSAVYHGVKNTLHQYSLIREFGNEMPSVKPVHFPKPVEGAESKKTILEIAKPVEKPNYENKKEFSKPPFLEVSHIKPIPVDIKDKAGINEGNIVDSKDSLQETYKSHAGYDTNYASANSDYTNASDSDNKEQSHKGIIDSSASRYMEHKEHEYTEKHEPKHVSFYQETIEDTHEYKTGNELNEQELPYIEAAAPLRDDSIKHLSEAAIIGQAFDTYILLQNGQTLYIIDQHAAHERIRYETLKRRLESEADYSQGLLEPLIVKLSAQEFDFAMDKRDIFNKLGFDMESFGPGTVIIRSVPDFYEGTFGIDDFHEILDRWIKSNTYNSIISEDVLHTMSCKGAIKANKFMSREEIRALVDDLCKMENPWTCVHGRPVVIKVDKKEFEKKFKRIV